jgi:type I restriction enzyme S subunit
VSELPKSWVKTSLEEAAHIQMGQSPPSTTYNTSGDGLPFFQGKAEFGKLYPTVEKWCSEPVRIANKDDILITVRAPVGPTNLAPSKCCIGRGLAAISGKGEIDTRYLLFFFRSIERWLGQQGTGSTFTAINRDFLEELEIPIAPLNEQKRIVAKLDELLPKVEACKQRLEKIPTILKRFRQSVLAAAVSGRLTEAWRKSNKTEDASVLLSRKAETNSDVFSSQVILERTVLAVPCSLKRQIEIEELPQLPTGWAYTFIGPLLADWRRGMKTGPFGTTLKKSEHLPVGVPVLGIENISEDGFVLGSKIHISKEKAEQLKEYQAIPNDIVISRSGTVGEVCVVPPDVGEARISTNLMRIRLDQKIIDPRFFCILVRGSEAVLAQIRLLCKGSTRDFLNQGILSSIIFPLPSLAEQREIVSMVDGLFSLLVRLDQRHQNSLRFLSRTTDAILSKAFSGALVNQDPSDEPASTLLERLKTSAATSTNGSKPKRTRKM